jgi:hypothetical protein
MHLKKLPPPQKKNAKMNKRVKAAGVLYHEPYGGNEGNAPHILNNTM